MFDPTSLVGFHTLLSLVALGTGVLAVLALFGLRLAPVWTQLFLTTAFITSATGFVLPAAMVLPSHIVGVLALLVLGAMLLSKVVGGFDGFWHAVYAVGMVASLYFLVFVAVAQAFAKVPALKVAAPTLSEPPFAISQGIVLMIFLALGLAALKLFRRTAPITI